MMSCIMSTGLEEDIMNESAIRQMLADLATERKAAEERLAAIKMAESGLERMLRSVASGASPESPFAHTYKPKGPVSIRGTLLKVIEEAAGTPMHVKDLWNEVKRRGAVSNAKDPISCIDFNLISLKNQGKPVEKVDRRTWRWTGGEAKK
jgi:hypothetical protein